MILEYSDLLHTLVQVSITLAGFIGLILVFQHSDRSAKNTIFHLLYTSLGVFTLSLLPLLLETVAGASLVDRIGCPVIGIWHGLGASRALLENRRSELVIPKALAATFALGSLLILIIGLAIGFGFLLGFAAGHYFFSLAWLLAVATSSFISLLYHGAGERSPD